MMLQDLFQRLYDMGIYDVMLPFLLIFVIVFAVLQKSNILGEGDDGRKYNAIIAMVMGLVVVIPHVIHMYPPNRDPVLILANVLPNVSIILVAILSFFFLISLFGGKDSWDSMPKIGGIVAILSFVAVGILFANATGFLETLPAWLGWLNNPDTQALLIMVAAFSGIVWFISKEPETEESKKGDDKFLQNLGTFLGGANSGSENKHKQNGGN